MKDKYIFLSFIFIIFLTLPSYAQETKNDKLEQIKTKFSEITHKISHIEKTYSNLTQIKESIDILLKNINTKLKSILTLLQDQEGNYTKKIAPKNQTKIFEAHKRIKKYNKIDNIEIKLTTYKNQIDKLDKLFTTYQNSSEKKEHSDKIDTIYSLLQKMQIQQRTINPENIVKQKQIKKYNNLNLRFNTLFSKIKRTIIKKTLIKKKKEILNISIQRLIDQGYNPGENVGKLTQYIQQFNSLRQQNMQMGNNMFIEKSKNANLQRQLNNKITEFSRRLKNLRIACYVKFAWERIKKIRSEIKNPNITDPELKECYLKLMHIKLPQSPLTYSVSRELSNLRNKLYNKKLKNKPRVKERAHEKLIEDMFDRKTRNRQIVNINDF